MANMQHLYQFWYRIPIRWRLSLASLGLLTLLLSALAVLVLFAAQQALLDNEAFTLRNEARLAAGGIKGHPFILTRYAGPPTASIPPNFVHAAAILAQRLAGTNAYTAILSPQGQVIASNDGSPFTPPRVVLSSSSIQQAFESGDTNNYLLVRDVHGRRQLVVLMSIVNQGEAVAILQISTPTQDEYISTLRFILLLGSLGALVLAIALTFPLVGAALRPLVDMERTSRRIAGGELSMRLQAPFTNDEIGRLAISFNRMVAQLEESFQRQKRFVADASHELRSPLTALSGGLEMLLMGVDNGETEATRRLARGMYAEVKRMHRLVEDLLALTRLDEGRMLIREGEVDVRVVMDKVCEHARQLSRGQKVFCELAPDTPLALADPDRLQQVLLNIVDNALKFSGKDGHVELLARGEGEEAVVIVVRDNGRGIPQVDLPHVFDRFYRVDASRSRQQQRVGGNGLGLAIARELVEAQQGEIAINSAPGEGTTVTILLKAAPVESTFHTVV